MVVYRKERRLRKQMYQAHKYIARNLKLLRNIKGLTQDQVSEMLHVSRTCYSNIEGGRKVPDFETIYILSKFYNISLDYLMAFDIAEHMLSLLRTDRRETEALHFIERYLKLSHGAKNHIRLRVQQLQNEENGFVFFPWEYGDFMGSNEK